MSEVEDVGLPEIAQRRSGVAQWLACWAHNPKGSWTETTLRYYGGGRRGRAGGPRAEDLCRGLRTWDSRKSRNSG